MSDDFFQQDYVFKLYYEAVGKHKVLTTAEERAFLLRYKTCPMCHIRLPHLTKRLACPKCGALTPDKSETRAITCTTCGHHFDFYVPPMYCPDCGSHRDYTARERILVSNLRFVVTMAKKYAKYPTHIQRLVSAGNVGLIVALDKFDVDRCTKFLTYAAWWIQKEIREELYNGGLVRIPSHKQKMQRKKMKLGAYICVRCGVRAHDPLLSCACSPDKAPEYVASEMLEDTCLVTSVPIDNLNIVDDRDDAELQYIDTTMADTLREAVTALDLRPRDKYILLQYYDIATDDRKNGSKTLPQIAEIAGVTPERVRQVKMRGLRELKKELVSISRCRGIPNPLHA